MDQPGLWEAERSLGTSGFLGYLTSSEAGDLTEALLTADKRRPSHSFSLRVDSLGHRAQPSLSAFLPVGHERDLTLQTPILELLCSQFIFLRLKQWLK